MPIGTETLREIRTLVRGGFNRRDEIVSIFCEEMYVPGELDQQEIEASVDSEFAALEKEKKRWPAVTDCDKVDAVFRALNERGLIAVQNAGYTQSDGYDDIRATYQSHPDNWNGSFEQRIRIRNMDWKRR